LMVGLRPNITLERMWTIVGRTLRVTKMFA
jgi:hypothetical protein